MPVQTIDEDFITDEEENPSGGQSWGLGFDITWQDGPLLVKDEDGEVEEKDPNGAFVETIIEAVIHRIEFFQGSKFHCLENALAIGYLKVALSVLEERTNRRRAEGTEGTHEV